MLCTRIKGGGYGKESGSVIVIIDDGGAVVRLLFK